jgi:hypothetical protein
MRMMVKLRQSAKKDGQRLPISRHTSATDRIDSRGGTFISSTSTVMAMAKTPSENASTRAFIVLLFF